MLKLKKILPVVCAAALVFSGCGADVQESSSADGGAAENQIESELDEIEDENADDAVNEDEINNEEEGMNEDNGGDSSAVKKDAEKSQNDSGDASAKKETSKKNDTAVNDAGKKSETKADASKPAASNTSSSNGGSSQTAPAPAPSPAEPSYTYKDGTYSGSAQGFNGPVGVSVTISKDKITSVSVTSSTDDEPYISDAKALCSKIVSANSADVSAVSGATYSSNGIKGAVKAALAKAKN